MKIQIIKCKTCGETYAACVEPVSTDWYKSCARALKTENAIIETIESEDGKVFSGNPLNKCCGKKIKK